MKLQSYLNDPQLKIDMVEEMEKHRAQDQIIKGTYGEENGVWKGCAVGCSLHSLNLRRGKTLKTNHHGSYETELGLPEWMALLEDQIFEKLPDAEAADFPVEMLRVIPVGVDLTPVKWHFCAYLLRENIDRVLALTLNDGLKNQVVSSIRGVLAVHESAIASGVWNESAARSAAESAWSAAESAWSAAYVRYAAELLRLLKEAK